MNKKILLEKLHKLTKAELAVLQRIMFAIETRFYILRGEKYADFFDKKRFGKIDDFELYKTTRMLDEDLKIVHIHEREDGPGFRVFFREDRTYDNFIDFKSMVDKELNRNDGTNALELFRSIKFVNGELSGGMTGNKLIIKKEGSLEYIVLQKAFELPIMSRIDASSFEDEDDLKFQQIYDTARSLNKKIKSTLEIDDFFKYDYPNKYIMRTV